MNRTFVLLFCTAALSACQPQNPPPTTLVKDKLENLGNRVIEGGETLKEGASAAKQSLESFGNRTQAGVETVKGGLTDLGNAVIGVTESESQNAPRP